MLSPVAFEYSRLSSLVAKEYRNRIIQKTPYSFKIYIYIYISELVYLVKTALLPCLLLVIVVMKVRIHWTAPKQIAIRLIRIGILILHPNIVPLCSLQSCSNTIGIITQQQNSTSNRSIIDTSSSSTFKNLTSNFKLDVSFTNKKFQSSQSSTDKCNKYYSIN